MMKNNDLWYVNNKGTDQSVHALTLCLLVSSADTDNLGKQFTSANYSHLVTYFSSQVHFRVILDCDT